MDEKFPLALTQGTVLAGQYIIERVLGQGGFGITYVAKDHKSDTLVAIKEFFPDTMATRNGTTVISFTGERAEAFEYGKNCFLQEAKTLAEFNDNDSIVGIKTYFEENSTAYFVMEYVEGESFDEYIKQKGGKISFEEACELLIPVMEALASVHDKGIVHRDVTPDNIFICNDGKVKLLDFGAARYSIGDKSKSLDVVLKHGFAPKEQYTRRGRQGAFTDVYSLGATFYYAITGKKLPDSIDRLEEDDMIPPSNLGVRIPEDKEEVLFKAISVQPQDRYQSMREFAAALKGAPEEIGKTVPVSESADSIGRTVPVADFTGVKSQQTVAESKETLPNKLKKLVLDLKKKNLLPAVIVGGSVIIAAIVVGIVISASGTNKKADLEKEATTTAVHKNDEDDGLPSGKDISEIGDNQEAPDPFTTGEADYLTSIENIGHFDAEAISNINNGGFVADGSLGTYVFVPGEGLCLYPVGANNQNGYSVLVSCTNDYVSNINVIGNKVLYTINGTPYLMNEDGSENGICTDFRSGICIRNIVANENGAFIEEVGDVDNTGVPDLLYYQSFDNGMTTKPVEVVPNSDIGIFQNELLYIDPSGNLYRQHFSDLKTAEFSNKSANTYHIVQTDMGPEEICMFSAIREIDGRNQYEMFFGKHRGDDGFLWNLLDFFNDWDHSKNFEYDVNDFEYMIYSYYDGKLYNGVDICKQGRDYNEDPSAEIHSYVLPDFENKSLKGWDMFLNPLVERKSVGLCFSRNLNEFYYYYTSLDKSFLLYHDVLKK